MILHKIEKKKLEKKLIRDVVIEEIATDIEKPKSTTKEIGTGVCFQEEQMLQYKQADIVKKVSSIVKKILTYMTK